MDVQLMRKIRIFVFATVLAAFFGHYATVKWLVENGCSIDERDNCGNSCLLFSARNGHLETVKWMIENGCSIDDKNNLGIITEIHVC